MKITVEAHVKADAQTAWKAWHDPKQIVQWNAASADWHTPSSKVDLRVGGKIVSRMEAKDGSMGFDFSATFKHIEAPKRVVSVLDDGREMEVRFQPEKGGTHIIETFDAEAQNDVEMQRAGWQAILDSFARHVDRKPRPKA